MEGSEFEAKLQQALLDLPEDQRVTLLMKRIEGKKQKEIAALLGISEKAVEKRLFKAMKTLRERLGDIF
jgi:RNA polymerase sigma-70 factor (ECF subfamily)